MIARQGFPFSFAHCTCNMGAIASEDDSVCAGCGTIKGNARTARMPSIVDVDTASRVVNALDAADKRGETMIAGTALRTLALRSM